jgi:6-pyruvoyltetrahydropterin/6-carboxytetrahydropterin synthase
MRSPPHRTEIQSEFERFFSSESFRFSSSHFVARHGHRERLHGHDYSLSLRLTGSNTIAPDGTFVDKKYVKQAIDKACQELDEMFLCPVNSNVMDITVSHDRCRQETVTMVCQDGSTFSFPKTDCAMLPLVHTTTEEIALYLWDRILQLVTADYLCRRGVLSMQVNVSEGQEKDETTVRLGIPRKMNRHLNVMDFMRKNEGNGAPIPFVIRESSPPGSLDDLISEDMSQLSIDITDRAEV